MQVQMKHRLSGICIAIHYHSVTVFGDSFFLGKLLCHQEQISDQRRISRAKVVDCLNVLTRDNEYMG